MATNDPLVPSMIFRSRTTKALSNVTEQKAWRRSLLSSTSLMRTSVITTVVLLYSVAHSNATANDEHAWADCLVRLVVQPSDDPECLLAVPAQGEQAAAAAAHQLPQAPEGFQAGPGG